MCGMMTHDRNLASLNPCFGGFGWERSPAFVQMAATMLSLNPCFGGFGWERIGKRGGSDRSAEVLILVLVDLGGKVPCKRSQ